MRRRPAARAARGPLAGPGRGCARPRSGLAVVLLAVALLAGCAPAGPSPTASVPASPTAGAPGSACTPAVTPAGDDRGDRVWYEVFVRSFADADGDGTGDLRGLLARLDHLNDGDPATGDDLGVGGLWLMPVAEAASYHGYDVLDYRAVERDYGTLDDLRAVVEAAHARGMRVIVDFVPNHTSRDHPWFREALVRGSPRDSWYVWEDAFPGWAGPGGETVWHEAGGRWYYAFFSPTMPELDLTDPEVTAALHEAARWWLEEVGVDGFRIDAAKHLVETGPDAQTNTPESRAWLAGLRAASVEADPGAVLVGEVWDLAVVAGGYVPDALDLTFDFGLATGIRLALQNGRAGPLASALLDSIRWWPANRNATFLSNHDQNRIASELRSDPAALRLAAFLLLTLPGTPFLYYGEEIGLPGTKPDERIRTPLPWTAQDPGRGFTTGTPWQSFADAPAGTNVAAQAADPGSLLATYRALIAARNGDPALRGGGAVPLATGSEAVGAWLRTTADRTVLVVANLSDAPVTTYGLELAAGPLCGPVQARLATAIGDPAGAISAPSVTVAGGFAAYVPVATLPARSGLVIELEPAVP